MPRASVILAGQLAWSRVGPTEWTAVGTWCEYRVTSSYEYGGWTWRVWVGGQRVAGQQSFSLAGARLAAEQIEMRGRG